MPNYLYALHDSDEIKKRSGMFLVNSLDAKKYNDQGYGIFRTVQSFKSEIRKAENLDQVIAYAIDIDDMSKEEQFERIKKIGIEPSKIVESKAGFHLYFLLENYGTPSLYTSFIEEYLIPLYNACSGSKDLARVLRVPGFYHCKNPEDKFMVNLVYSSPIKYIEKRLFEIVFDKFKKLKKELLLFTHSDLKNHCSIPKNTINKSAREIAMALGSSTQRGNSFMVCCPAHNDKDPSFHITQAGDKVLFHCFGGCTQEQVLKSLKERGLW